MKKLALVLSAAAFLIALSESAHAEIKRIGGYTRKNGTYVSSHYRDTSNDGNPYNNANYLGWND